MKRVQNLPFLEGPDGAPLLVQVDAGPGEAKSAAWWLGYMIGQVPTARLLTQDTVKVFMILRQVKKAETAGVIELEDDHYVWAMRMLFDDGEGKRLDPSLEGGYATGMYGMVGVALKFALEQWQVIGAGE